MGMTDEDWAAKSLGRQANDEWTEWLHTLPAGKAAAFSTHNFPDPRETNGLPDGWRVVTYRDYRAPRTHKNAYADDYAIFIAEHSSGGWVVGRHEKTYGVAEDDSVLVDGYSRMLWIHTNLASMYKDLRTPPGSLPPNRQEQQMGDVVAELLTTLFDDTDPTEAAEKTLFALTGVLTYTPAATRRVRNTR